MQVQIVAPLAHSTYVKELQVGGVHGTVCRYSKKVDECPSSRQVVCCLYAGDICIYIFGMRGGRAYVLLSLQALETWPTKLYGSDVKGHITVWYRTVMYCSVYKNKIRTHLVCSHVINSFIFFCTVLYSTVSIFLEGTIEHTQTQTGAADSIVSVSTFLIQYLYMYHVSYSKINKKHPQRRF